MFVGFDKIQKQSSKVVHLSTNGWSTICGLPVKDNDKNHFESLGNSHELDEDEHICKNCRSSIIKKGNQNGN